MTSYYLKFFLWIGFFSLNLESCSLFGAQNEQINIIPSQIQKSIKQTTPSISSKTPPTTQSKPDYSKSTTGSNLSSHSIEDDNKSLNPGIVANRDGEWVWSDHLLNLSNNIDVAVEITKPDNINLSITAGELKELVSLIFKKEGINPVANPLPGKPDLPSFHILILIFPIRDGYSCAVSGRLFEEVKLDRIKLDDTVTMQAITWDRTSIHVVSSGKLKDELIESVTEISNDFVERYRFFQQYKNQR